VKAVFFDIGGVLEINPRTGWQQRWAARLGLEPEALIRRLEPVWSRGDVGEVTLAEVEQQVAHLLGHECVSAFMGDVWAEYLGTLNDELARYFAGLRPRYRTGIISNSFVGAREREQAAYGFEDMCDVVVYSHEEGMKKPDRRIYEIACRRLRVHPADAVFLDDTPVNVEGAVRAGLGAIRFIDNAQARAALEAWLDVRPAGPDPP
jgi:epoxide hydrolase-like predicted phosphatase